MAKYLAIPLLFFLWLCRLSMTAEQGHAFMSASVTGNYRIESEGFRQENTHKPPLSFSDNTAPISPMGRVEHSQTPVSRTTSLVRFVSVPAGAEAVLSLGERLKARARDECFARFRALLERADYYIYALRKIII